MPLHGRRFQDGSQLTSQPPPLGDGGSGSSGTGGTNIASGATGSGSIKLGRGVVLNSITSDKAARVRCYGTEAQAKSDLNRKIGTPPKSNVICQAEFIFTLPNETITCDPKVTLINGDTPQSSLIYYNITNLSGGSTTIGLDINYTPYL